MSMDTYSEFMVANPVLDTIPDSGFWLYKVYIKSGKGRRAIAPMVEEAKRRWPDKIAKHPLYADVKTAKQFGDEFNGAMSFSDLVRAGKIEKPYKYVPKEEPEF